MDKIKTFLERWWIVLLILAALPFFALTAVNNEKGVNYLNNDFFTFWLSGHLVSIGAHPYVSADWVGGHHANGATWIPNQIFPYPLPLALLMIPLGVMSLQQGYLAWEIVSQLIMLLAIVWMALRWEGVNRQVFAVVVLIAIAFNSNIRLMLMTGTIAPLFLVFLVLALHLLEKKRDFSAGLALSLMALKPTLLTIVALIGLWLLFQRKWRAILGGLSGGLGLLAIGMILDVHWVEEFRAAGENLFNLRLGSQPTIVSYARLACRADMTCALSLYLLVILVLIGLYAWLVWRKRDLLEPMALFGIAIPLGVLLPPYIWSYDYVLLVIPICFICFEFIRRWSSYLQATLFLLLLDALSLGAVTLFWLNPESPALTIQRDMWSIWVAILVLVIAWWCTFRFTLVQPAPEPGAN